MTARLTHCRDPLWFGGNGLELTPPLNSAAQTWTVSDNAPAGAQGYCGPKPAISLNSTIYAASAAPLGSGAVLVSSDGGSSWAAESVPSTYSAPYAVCAVGDRVLAFCEDYAYERGAPWAPFNATEFYVSPVTHYLGAEMQVAYGNGVCVLFVGNLTLYYRSTDGGYTWAAENLPFASLASNAPSLLWNGSEFVAVIETSNASIDQIVTSPDGLTWTQFPLSSTPSGLEYLGYGGGIYAAGTTSALLVGDSIAALQAAPLKDIFTGKTQSSVAVLADGRIMVELTDGTIHTSADGGSTWVADTVPWALFSSTEGPIAALGDTAYASALYTDGQGAWAKRQELC